MTTQVQWEKNFQDMSHHKGMHHFGEEKEFKGHIQHIFTYFTCADEQFIPSSLVFLLYLSYMFCHNYSKCEKNVWFDSSAEICILKCTCIEHAQNGR